MILRNKKQIRYNNDDENLIKGLLCAILGTIGGDIIGSRYENWDNGISSTEFPLFDIDDDIWCKYANENDKKIFDEWKKIEHMRDKCDTTDDTILTLAVSEALIEWKNNKKYKSLKDLSKLAIKYIQKFGLDSRINGGYGLSFGDYYLNGIPNGYHNGKLFSTPQGPLRNDRRYFNSNANGSAMRISAIGILANSEQEIKDLVRAVTIVSHNDEGAIKGAEAIAMAIYLSKIGKTKQEIQTYIEKNYYSDYKFHNNIDDFINSTREKYWGQDLSCNVTVPIALDAFFSCDNYEDAMRACVAINGDTDTIAAMCGGIAGIHYGIPKLIINKIKNYTEKAKYINIKGKEVFFGKRFMDILWNIKDSLKENRNDIFYKKEDITTQEIAYEIGKNFKDYKQNKLDLNIDNDIIENNNKIIIKKDNINDNKKNRKSLILPNIGKNQFSQIEIYFKNNENKKYITTMFIFDMMKKINDSDNKLYNLEKFKNEISIFEKNDSKYKAEYRINLLKKIYDNFLNQLNEKGKITLTNEMIEIFTYKEKDIYNFIKLYPSYSNILNNNILIQKNIINPNNVKNYNKSIQKKNQKNNNNSNYSNLNLLNSKFNKNAYNPINDIKSKLNCLKLKNKLVINDKKQQNIINNNNQYKFDNKKNNQNINNNQLNKYKNYNINNHNFKNKKLSKLANKNDILPKI